MLPFYRFAILAAVLGSVFLTPAQAAELGDPVIRTYIGQPLIADVELNTLNDPASTVTVRMAHADVYKGANVSMNPVVGSINMSVMKRDGRQYLHLTSTRAVSTENVHLFLELTDGGKRSVRAVTLWLTPDPSPPAPPPPPPPPVIPVIATPAAAPVPAAVAVGPIARPVRVLTLPKTVVAAATCPAPQFTSDQIKACEVMDEKNAALSAQIVDLEAKVKLLQQAIEGKAAAPAAASVPAPPPPPKKKPTQEEGGFPWLVAIGIVVLLGAIGGGVWYVLRRRKGASAVAPDPAPAAAAPWHQRLRARFKRRPKPAAADAAPTP